MQNFHTNAISLLQIYNIVFICKVFSLKDIKNNRRDRRGRQEKESAFCCGDWTESCANPFVKLLLFCFNLFLCDSAISAVFIFLD